MIEDNQRIAFTLPHLLLLYLTNSDSTCKVSNTHTHTHTHTQWEKEHKERHKTNDEWMNNVKKYWLNEWLFEWLPSWLPASTVDWACVLKWENQNHICIRILPATQHKPYAYYEIVA